MSDGINSLPSEFSVPLVGSVVEYGALENFSLIPTECEICKNPFSDPVILSCLHIFDESCLQSYEQHDNLVPHIKCPKCEAISGGLKTLPRYDCSIMSEQVSSADQPCGSPVKCSVCTDGNEALYRCLHCAGTLCERCRNVHKVMKLFSNHEILILTDEERQNSDALRKTMQNTKPVPCSFHPDSVYNSFCVQCHVPLCKICFDCDHKGHITSPLNSVSEHVESLVKHLNEECADKRRVLQMSVDQLHDLLSHLSLSRDRNKNSITDTYDHWIAAIDGVKDIFLQRNRELHEELESKVWSKICTVGETIDHIDYACEFSKSYVKKCSNIEMCKLAKCILACFDHLSKASIKVDESAEVKFEPALSSVKQLVQQNFGNFLSNDESQPTTPLGPCDGASSHVSSVNALGDCSDDLKRMSLKTDKPIGNGLSIMQTQQLNHHSLVTNIPNLHYNVPILNGSDMFNSRASESVVVDRSVNHWTDAHLGLTHYQQTDFPSMHTENFVNDPFFPDVQSINRQFSAIDSDPNSIRRRIPHPNATLYEFCRIRAARCSQMNLLTKWGSLGCELGRLNSPHGFCLGFDEEIVIADTYNHRIQIFTKRGDFISFFGVSGRVDGLLWYPRKVAIIRQSQRYVVCDRGNERSRMQLFSRSGHFVRRIPIQYIEIVAGLAVNQHGHIIAIDSVSPSLFVISEEGDLLRSFDCRSHMKEPSDVAIHGREYFICDFKAHCVIVLHEDGTFLRRIGGESITDFPNGIDVSDHGDVLVGDSHGNRFHIAVFSRTGELLSEFLCHQTKITRSCCLKITTEGYVVTLARASNTVLVLDTLYVCPSGPTM